MPTFTSVTLDRFLEPKRIMPSLDSKKLHLLSDSPSFSFPPSPSITNHKRHEEVQNVRNANGNGNGNGKGVFGMTHSVLSPNDEVVKTYDKFGNGDSSSALLVPVSADTDGVSETDFFDPRDSLSVTSSSETDDMFGNYCSFKMSTPTAEFYDAPEELSEVGSQSSSFRDVETELRERRLSWLMEIERRKQAEESIEIMKQQWQRLSQKLLHEGFTLPSPSDHITTDDDEKSEFDPAEDLCQQIRLARTVSQSIGKGAGKAEAEMEFEPKLESKNFEIARLLQRLRYYEDVNSEMSLRNQEATDLARRLRQKRKRRQKWLWRGVGASVVLGSMAIAWSLYRGGSASDDLRDGENAGAVNEQNNRN